MPELHALYAHNIGEAFAAAATYSIKAKGNWGVYLDGDPMKKKSGLPDGRASPLAFFARIRGRGGNCRSINYLMKCRFYLSLHKLQ